MVIAIGYVAIGVKVADVKIIRLLKIVWSLVVKVNKRMTVILIETRRSFANPHYLDQSFATGLREWIGLGIKSI